MNRIGRWLAAFCAAASSIVVFSNEALAQECLLGPAELPGLSGAPQWFGAAGGTDWRPQLNDPRWAGAPVRMFGTSSVLSGRDDAQYRVLLSGNKLYVSIQAITDDVTTSIDLIDTVFFGLTQGSGGTNAWLASVIPDRTSAVVAGPAASVPRDPTLPAQTDAVSYINWYQTANHTAAMPTWNSHPGEQPAWLEDVASFRDSPGVKWAVTFKVNLTTLGASGPLKIFVGTRINNSAGVLKLANAVYAPSDTDSIGGETIAPKVVTGNWQNFLAPGSACTAGVTFSSMNIGRFNGSTLTNKIQACNSPATCTPPKTNTFRVNAQNVPSGGISTHAIRAKFRIADWGSTIATWQFAPWRAIPGLPDTIFTDTLASVNADGSWAWNFASGGAVGEATIDYTCKVQGADGYCPKLTNADGEDHQCMLVELAAAPGVSGISFQNATAYRNMEYQGLSSVSTPATISIKGLQQVTGQAVDRDVYLYVETKNMPGHGSEPIWLPTKAMQAAQHYAEHPPILQPRTKDQDAPNPDKPVTAQPNARPPLTTVRLPAGTANREPSGATAAAALNPPLVARLSPDRVPSRAPTNLLEVPVLTSEQALAEVWPTYKVHVYYDTGKTTTIKGQTRPVLEAMVPFGFYLDHQGPLYGFTHALEGIEGAVVTQIAPNFYKVRIANEGQVRVKTTITAEEKPKSSGGGTGPGGGTCKPCQVDPGRCNCRAAGAPAERGLMLPVLALAAALMLRRTRRSTQSSL